MNDVKAVRLMLWRGNSANPQDGDECVAMTLRPAATENEIVEAAASMAWAMERRMKAGVIGS